MGGSEQTLKHFIHPHLLEISDYQETKNAPSTTTCAACKLDPIGWVCTCKKCNYLLHFQCSQIPHRIMLPFHKEHILSLESKRSALLGKLACDACREKIYGYSYSCNGCNVDIHIHCSKMRQIVVHKSHEHPLYLEFSLPDGAKSFRCDICKGDGSNHWLYRCKKCGFHAHLNCATPKPTFSGSAQSEEIKEETSNSSKVNERKESTNRTSYKEKEKEKGKGKGKGKGKVDNSGPTLSDEGDEGPDLNDLGVSDMEDSEDNDEGSDEGEDGPDSSYMFEQMEEELGPTLSDLDIGDSESDDDDDSYGPNVSKEKKKNSNKGRSSNKGGSKNKKDMSEDDDSTDVDDEDRYGSIFPQGRKNKLSPRMPKSNKGGLNKKDVGKNDDRHDTRGKKKDSEHTEPKSNEGASGTKKRFSYDDDSDIDSDVSNDEIVDYRNKGNRF